MHINKILLIYIDYRQENNVLLLYYFTSLVIIIKNMTKYKNRIICINCGSPDHGHKNCHEPITSYGIINVNILENYNEKNFLKKKYSTKYQKNMNITSKKYPDIYLNDIKNINNYDISSSNICIKSPDEYNKFNYYKDKLLFMMVSRKYSLGFVEFIRGKYDVSDVKTIVNLFEQMYESEITIIATLDFDSLLFYFINRSGSDENKSEIINEIYEGRYAAEYTESKMKFNLLKYKTGPNSEFVNLDLYFYTKNIKPKWPGEEWGFPKGRRDRTDNHNINSAIREFGEETGYDSSDYILLDMIHPITENLVGTNDLNYKHVYYISIDDNDKGTCHNFDKNEIAQVEWFTYNDALKKIRPYHNEKKKALTTTYLFILDSLIKKTN